MSGLDVCDYCVGDVPAATPVYFYRITWATGRTTTIKFTACSDEHAEKMAKGYGYVDIITKKKSGRPKRVVRLASVMWGPA